MKKITPKFVRDISYSREYQSSTGGFYRWVNIRIGFFKTQLERNIIIKDPNIGFYYPRVECEGEDCEHTVYDLWLVWLEKDRHYIFGDFGTDSYGDENEEYKRRLVHALPDMLFIKLSAPQFRDEYSVYTEVSIQNIENIFDIYVIESQKYVDIDENYDYPNIIMVSKNHKNKHIIPTIERFKRLKIEIQDEIDYREDLWKENQREAAEAERARRQEWIDDINTAFDGVDIWEDNDL